MFELGGLALGAIGAIGKLFGAGKANKKLSALQASDPTYTANPLANERLGLAKTLLNARMPGAASIERNIYGNQANTLSNIDRNATDSSQALSLAGGVQGQTNDAFNKLGIQEGQNYQQNYQNLVGAEQGAINEGDKVYDDSVRRFGDRAQIQGQQNQNNQNVWQSVANAGFGIADYGINGGFGNPFKKKSGLNNSTSAVGSIPGYQNQQYPSGGGLYNG